MVRFDEAVGSNIISSRFLQAFLAVIADLENLQTLTVGPQLFYLEEPQQSDWLLHTIPSIFSHIRSQKMARLSLNLQFNPLAFTVTAWTEFEDHFNEMWVDVSRLLSTAQFERCVTGVHYELSDGSPVSDFFKYSPVLPWVEGRSSWRVSESCDRCAFFDCTSSVGSCTSLDD